MSNHKGGLTLSVYDRLLQWGDMMSKRKDWNKSDSNVYAILLDERKEFLKERYKNSVKQLTYTCLDKEIELSKMWCDN